MTSPDVEEAQTDAGVGVGKRRGSGGALVNAASGLGKLASRGELGADLEEVWPWLLVLTEDEHAKALFNAASGLGFVIRLARRGPLFL